MGSTGVGGPVAILDGAEPNLVYINSVRVARPEPTEVGHFVPSPEAFMLTDRPFRSTRLLTFVVTDHMLVDEAFN